MTYKINPIGIVQNSFNEAGMPKQIKMQESTIILNKDFEEGLFKIEDSTFLDVYFIFHKSEEYRLKGQVFTGEVKGVFASRSPKRPNFVGHTTVKLLERKENCLVVIGLDAINGTPVIDIKPIDNSIFEGEYEKKEIDNIIRASNPRIEIMGHIWNNETKELLIKAAQMHGHFCPGLAMGVMAACYAMNRIKGISDGMEDLLAITETNNCFSDGIQFVTACSFGNNALIFKDFGKTAFTLTKRDGRGIRLVSKDESREEIRKAYPEFTIAYEEVVKKGNRSDEALGKYKQAGIKRAFATLEISIEKLFEIMEVEVEIPDYAPSHNSINCSKCGESTMEPRIIYKDNKPVCLNCSKSKYNVLQRDGIICREIE
ncbi:MAG: SAM-dependent methyltransferase [Bacteroidales bacterium]|nr:SAM-dependent methyltransferase [Bacteroidales bacterium]